MRLKLIFGSLIFVSVMGSFFAYSLHLRESYFGELSMSRRGHQWLTASTVKFARNWFREGPFKLRFLMLENPASIEFKTLEDRTPYFSYPPGVVLAPYLVSKITSQEPSVRMVMGINLASHFLIALLLGLLSFLIMCRVGPWNLLTLFSVSAVPSLIYLFSPGPMYWHQNVYFSDQAILLPFALILALEAVRVFSNSTSLKRFTALVEPLVLFYGALTDWFFVWIYLLLALRRLSDTKSFKKCLRFLLPGVVALFLFLLQLSFFDGFSVLSETFLKRANLGPVGPVEASGLWEVFWIRNMTRNFGISSAGWIISLEALLLILGFVFNRRLFKNSTCQEILYFSALPLAPCVLHTFFLSQHAKDHAFTALKFTIPFALITFVCLPLLVMEFVKEHLPEMKRFFRPIIMGLTALYLMFVLPHVLSEFVKPDHSIEQLGVSVQKVSTYEDILVSPDFEIPSNPPQWLAYSMKRVYQIVSPDELRAFLKALKVSDSANLLILFQKTPAEDWRNFLKDRRPDFTGPLMGYRLSLAF